MRGTWKDLQSRSPWKKREGELEQGTLKLINLLIFTKRRQRQIEQLESQIPPGHARSIYIKAPEEDASAETPKNKKEANKMAPIGF